MTKELNPLKDKHIFSQLMGYEDQLLNNNYDLDTVTEIIGIYAVFLSEFDFVL